MLFSSRLFSLSHSSLVSGEAMSAKVMIRRCPDYDVDRIEHIISDEAFATGSALIAEAGSI